MVPEHHAIDHDDAGQPEESSPDIDAAWLEQFAALADRPTRRSDFLSGAGKLTVAGLGLGGLAGALAGSAAARTASLAASTRLKKIGLIEVTFSPFFTQIFQNPMKAYLKKKQPDWGITFGNENGSVPTGITLFNQYVAANYGVLFLSTGDQMSAWQSAVQKATKQGAIFINHSTQAVTGATQNTLFSHKQSGVDVGNAAVAWAHKNGITQPVVGLLGNLSDAQGSKRTTWAWKTIKAKFPNAKLAGSAQAVSPAAQGATAAANLLAAHPDMNIMISFDTIAGVGALTSCTHAGKTDRNKFFLGMVDAEDATLKLIAAGNSIVQANWGAFFAASGILMVKDAINAYNGKPIKPTRLILGQAITTPAQAKSFDSIAYDALNPKYAYVYTKYFKYLNTPTKTGQVPPGQ